jgi:hypothetical protein
VLSHTVLQGRLAIRLSGKQAFPSTAEVRPGSRPIPRIFG